METLLLCEPKYFSINYQINPWMKLENNSIHEKALEQWNIFYNLLTNFCTVKLIEPQKDLPDMVFTANAGLPIKGENQLVLSKFKYQERVNEEVWFKKWFEEQGYTVSQPNSIFEGAGDALYLNEHLITGYGFRSEKRPIDQDSIDVKLIDSRFYHLDTCFCPLNNGDFLIFADAFNVSDFESIKRVGNHCISVPEEEALNFACNSVLVDENVILMPKDCPFTSKTLKEMGYEVFELDMSEFLKSGGACKCLSLKI